MLTKDKKICNNLSVYVFLKGKSHCTEGSNVEFFYI